jgi:putative ABC transport system ATP-binding protein
MAPLIELRQVHKVYATGGSEVRALRGVSLTIERGEFVALVGASGSGKSTLMNILGCLDHPTSGTYLLEGQDIGRLSRTQLALLRNQKLGFVFQNFNLLQRYTAGENVELPMLYADVPPRERRERALRLLAQVGLAGRVDHRPNELSGGEQQRVAIARALSNRPQLFFADEPTGNLDSATGAAILAEFERLNREQGQTILLVTHDPTVAAHAPRMVTVKDGLILSDVTKAMPTVPEEVTPVAPPRAVQALVGAGKGEP